MFSLPVGQAWRVNECHGGETIRLAAAELRNQLALILQNDSSTNGAAQKSITFAIKSGLGAEEFCVESEHADRLLIAGGSAVGILYGVYAFLEQIGLCFAPPGLADTGAAIPRLSEIRLAKALRDKPTFLRRGLAGVGGMLPADFLFYKHNILDVLPAYRDLLDWMGRKRLNVLQIALGAKGDYGCWDPRGNLLVKDSISALIGYRDFPALKWIEKYGAQIERNRDFVKQLIAYAAVRGILITLFAPEPVFIQPALDAYPELLGAHGHALCPAADATWHFIASRYEELFGLFPELQVRLFPSYDSHGSGPAWSRLNVACQDCRELPGALRYGKLFEVVKAARDRTGSRAEISVWPWPMQKNISHVANELYNYRRNELHKEPILAFKNTELLAQLNFTIPADVVIHDRACFGEPIETQPYLMTPFVGAWTRHREYYSLHQIGEHIGVNSFPCVYTEGNWQNMARYLAGMGAQGLFCEAGYSPAASDPSGIYLGNIDFYAFAAWAWNPETGRTAIWQEWSRIFFPEAPEAAADILRDGYRIIKTMYHSSVTDWQSIPKRCSFREQGVEKLLHWNVALNRAHGLAIIAEKQGCLERLDLALKRLEQIKTQIGERKYALWRKNLDAQKARASLFCEFVRLTVLYSLFERAMTLPEDVQALRASCRNIAGLLRVEPPPMSATATAMQKKRQEEQVNPWGNSWKEYLQAFGELTAECERRIQNHS